MSRYILNIVFSALFWRLGMFTHITITSCEYTVETDLPSLILSLCYNKVSEFHSLWSVGRNFSPTTCHWLKVKIRYKCFLILLINESEIEYDSGVNHISCEIGLWLLLWLEGDGMGISRVQYTQVTKPCPNTKIGSMSYEGQIWLRASLYTLLL